MKQGIASIYVQELAFHTTAEFVKPFNVWRKPHAWHQLRLASRWHYFAIWTVSKDR
jgi:hypothetical protein